MTNFVRQAEKTIMYPPDISRALQGRVNIVEYNQLSNIDEMLGPHKCFAMLYLFPGTKVGHWVCGFLLKGRLHLFDPYGLMPDEPMKMMGSNSTAYRDVISQSRYYPDNIIYNRFKYQHPSENIDTCGRHVVVRLLFRMMDNEEYHTLMMGQLGRTPDERVTLMTMTTSI